MKKRKSTVIHPIHCDCRRCTGAHLGDILKQDSGDAIHGLAYGMALSVLLWAIIIGVAVLIWGALS